MAIDGSKLWRRYDALPESLRKRVAPRATQIVVAGNSPTLRIIRDELQLAILGMLGAAPQTGADNLAAEGAIVAGTPASSPLIRDLKWDNDLSTAGSEGFVLRSANISGKAVTVVASINDVGALYGAFHLLRLMQTGQPTEKLSLIERPRVKLRLLNHWDNLNGTIERGYAGKSLWQWDDLPNTLSPRYTEYAMANASIGINGTVLNNVNANAQILTPEYLRKVAALADQFRPFGIRVYLSANFAAPRSIGNLSTADPLDPMVIDWWKKKADEIYARIPDFGGFLVKANSEGQPGPQDYNRTHADGANCLADAIGTRGVVMWRAFIYNDNVDPDRIKRAYIEFMALEGKFRENVIVQVKNGPLDFMPREPFHPLFGAMTQTAICAEMQITQEYLGQSKHLVFLGTMWKEFLDSDTFAKGPGSTVGDVLAGSVHEQKLTGIVGVANTGTDANWCGHEFSQANWYAFGRLAWDHTIPAEHLAEEWTQMTLTRDAETMETIKQMLLDSRETFVNYTMPLGLHHLIGGDHYAPMPQNDRAQRADWTATYYHRADANGIGFDRTRKGDRAVEQYFPQVCDMFDGVTSCPEKLLLFFHRVAWDYRMQSGLTLWQELCEKYFKGAADAEELQRSWNRLAGKIDAEQHQRVADRLAIQVADATQWRDQILAYFQKFSGMPISMGNR